jgi:hypothetical protein
MPVRNFKAKKITYFSEMISLYGSALNFWRQWKDKTLDLARIKSAIYYLKAVQSLRLVCLGLAGFVIISMLLLAGIATLHVLLLSILPMSERVRIAAAAILIVIDLGIPIALGAILFSEKMWMRLSKSDEMVDRAVPPEM